MVGRVSDRTDSDGLQYQSVTGVIIGFLLIPDRTFWKYMEKIQRRFFITL
jgi:hypothetical protein